MYDYRFDTIHPLLHPSAIPIQAMSFHLQHLIVLGDGQSQAGQATGDQVWVDGGRGLVEILNKQESF